MIDIHSHILPGLDDGSQTLETSVTMLCIAAESGTTDIVATPHADLKFTFQPELITEKIEELARAAGDSIRIHRGCDFHLSFENIEDALAHPTKYTINHRCYLLVEFSDLLILRNTSEIFDHLLLAGMIPIITHPERNWLLRQRLSLIEGWIAQGALLQVTALSLLGRFGSDAKSFSDDLLRRGLAHFIASDAHGVEDRNPRLDQARQYVANRFGEAQAQRLFVTNPGKTLTGEPIEKEEGDEDESQSRKWYRFWR